MLRAGAARAYSPAVMDAVAGQNRSWFRSVEGRRFGREVAVLVLIKLAALIVLYCAFVAVQPRIDTSPAALRTHLGDATAPKDGGP